MTLSIICRTATLWYNQKNIDNIINFIPSLFSFILKDNTTNYDKNTKYLI
jgi:hypothetical protein